MKKGDHLVSSRMGYTHHGLYIGNGEVIHYSGFSDAFNKGTIEVTSVEDFKQGSNCEVKSHLICVYDADERVERALSKCGEDSYNIVFNNCEHFVSWCFNGFKSSSQVNSAAAATATLANEYMKRKAAETTASVIAQQATRTTATKAAVTSAVAKTAVSTTASTAAGLTAASAVTGSTVAGVVSAVAAGSLVSAATPVAIAVGVGYGVKKVIDWLWD